MVDAMDTVKITVAELGHGLRVLASLWDALELAW
jgi:hypothetical protein